MDIKTLEAAMHARDSIGRNLKQMEEMLAQARAGFHDGQYAKCSDKLNRLREIIDGTLEIMKP